MILRAVDIQGLDLSANTVYLSRKCRSHCGVSFEVSLISYMSSDCYCHGAGSARKSIIGGSIRAAFRDVGPVQHAHAGDRFKVSLEVPRIEPEAMRRLTGETIGNGVGVTTAAPRGGPVWMAERRKGCSTVAGRAPKGPTRWMVSCDLLRVLAGCVMLAMWPTHCLYTA